MRGVIIGPTYRPIGNTGIQFGPFDTSALRHFLLYWDKLDFPQSNIIAHYTPPEFDFLESEGILTYSDVRLTGSFMINANLMAVVQNSAFLNREKKEPGCWSIAQDAPYLISSEQDVVNTRSLEILLMGCLPVPSQDVSLQDILEFKLRRESELLALRAFIDELYQGVLSSADDARAFDAAIERLKNGIQDIQRSANESFDIRLRRSLSFNFSLKEAAIMTLGLSAGVPIEFASALGAISAIDLNIKELLLPNCADRKSNGALAIVSRIENELQRN